MEEKKYAVIVIKYYLNINTFSTEKCFEVLKIFNRDENIDSFIRGYSSILEKSKDSFTSDGRMLTSFSVDTREFDKNMTDEEIRDWVLSNCSYEWGNNWTNDDMSNKTR